MFVQPCRGLEWAVVIPRRHCEGCDQVFRPKRSNQKYHDAACRQAAYRARNVTERTESVTETGESVTDERPWWLIQAEAWIRLKENTTGHETGWFR